MNATAASVPIATARVAAIAATSRLRPVAWRIVSLWNSAPYQRVEKPPHTVTRREALNEYRTTEKIGRYRKA